MRSLLPLGVPGSDNSTSIFKDLVYSKLQAASSPAHRASGGLCHCWGPVPSLCAWVSPVHLHPCSSGILWWTPAQVPSPVTDIGPDRKGLYCFRTVQPQSGHRNEHGPTWLHNSSDLVATAQFPYLWSGNSDVDLTRLRIKRTNTAKHLEQHLTQQHSPSISSLN